MNGNVDAIAKLESQKNATLLGIIPLEIKESHAIPTGSAMQIDEAELETWMIIICKFIRNVTLPTHRVVARRLCYKAAKYVEYDGILYRMGYNQPLLKCIMVNNVPT